MTIADLWHFVRQQGLRPAEVVAALAGALLLLLEIWLIPAAWRKPAARRTYGDVLGPVLAIAIGCLLLTASWSLVHKRYLLRPGAGRYTVATVIELDSWRGQPRFTCAYAANAQRYQTGQGCGTAPKLALPGLTHPALRAFCPRRPGRCRAYCCTRA
jgi:hypothetical protein